MGKISKIAQLRAFDVNEDLLNHERLITSEKFWEANKIKKLGLLTSYNIQNVCYEQSLEPFESEIVFNGESKRLELYNDRPNCVIEGKGAISKNIFVSKNECGLNIQIRIGEEGENGAYQVDLRYDENKNCVGKEFRTLLGELFCRQINEFKGGKLITSYGNYHRKEYGPYYDEFRYRIKYSKYKFNKQVWISRFADAEISYDFGVSTESVFQKREIEK
ncbi:hypothetical protein [Aureibacter tunicatorum]|uniref:Uncharacterized protein n=1 Tax=Aureibacter tunicatorum TaxID=866807 RepID=A0AAE4BSI0_9BACT|nr:hypothetical protein [Aureibacter tunicatorum]MDR6239786.1 hypothetical protein [Aureibacter tunicatorum]BDD04261.1 hypothetical protein AUTU_17440 [Aureibacter tunicatorum]